MYGCFNIVIIALSRAAFVAKRSMVTHVESCMNFLILGDG